MRIADPFCLLPTSTRSRGKVTQKSTRPGRHAGDGDSGIGWHSRSLAAWNQMEKLMDYFEHWLPELLHIQCKKKKRNKIKINQAHIPYSVPENLVFYQVQNSASFIVQHLFISYEVTWKKLSMCPSSSPCLRSQVSQIHKVFIHNHLHPFLSIS